MPRLSRLLCELLCLLGADSGGQRQISFEMPGAAIRYKGDGLFRFSISTKLRTNAESKGAQMELMQLEMFVAVVEERSFLRAAERVFRTQPAVSIGLRKLEGRIGIPLLDRSHRRSGQLTPAGEVLYEYASRILGLRDEALSALKEEHCIRAGILRVGVMIGENFEWIPQLATSFNNRYPEIRLEILCDRSVNFFKDLEERRMDIALLSGRPKSDVQNKSLIVTRVRGCRQHEAFWVARRRLGRSPLACAFEEILMRHFQDSLGTQNLKRLELHRRSASKRCGTDRLISVKNASR